MKRQFVFREGPRVVAALGVIAMLLATPARADEPKAEAAHTDPAAIHSRVAAAIANILQLVRPNQDGVATVWDGNKFVQCRRMVDGVLRCEGAGRLMQPTLASALTSERIAALASAGWHLDPTFGNYVQSFSDKLPADQIGDQVLAALVAGYDADPGKVEVGTAWIDRVACPPRAGFSQNLAGSINNSPAMTDVVITGCNFVADAEAVAPVTTLDALVARDEVRVTGEIGRLRVNAASKVFAVFGTGIGYVQCAPETDPVDIYCEAQSAAEWPALAAVLTPEHVTRLHALGFADPGRAPNYWQVYDATKDDDGTIARNILTTLFDVYGYRGAPALQVTTEQ